jgi:hypothetical protein
MTHFDTKPLPFWIRAFVCGFFELKWKVAFWLWNLTLLVTSLFADMFSFQIDVFSLARFVKTLILHQMVQQLLDRHFIVFILWPDVTFGHFDLKTHF